MLRLIAAEGSLSAKRSKILKTRASTFTRTSVDASFSIRRFPSRLRRRGSTAILTRSNLYGAAWKISQREERSRLALSRAAPMTMNRELRFTPEAARALKELEASAAKGGQLKQVRKTLGLLETNLRHP